MIADVDQGIKVDASGVGMVVDASRGMGVNASGIGINFGASLQKADGKLEVVANAGIPQGLIVMFSGAVIPQGWALCDATDSCRRHASVGNERCQNVCGAYRQGVGRCDQRDGEWNLLDGGPDACSPTQLESDLEHRFGRRGVHQFDHGQHPDPQQQEHDRLQRFRCSPLP
ncbi:hypothetical protein A3218_05665 [Pseudomonas chlororaphis]|nr:hypothetical protein A3218_05665 [Pseudomonas chlororaphis]